jgi:4-hydroxybenzoate polyprenyltransferase
MADRTDETSRDSPAARGPSTAVSDAPAWLVVGRLLRFPNLLIVALTQVLVYAYVIRDRLVEHGLAPQLPIGAFAQLVLATVLVSAAGYLINDLFDRTADRYNLAAPPAVERFGIRQSWWLYGILITLGAVLSIALAHRLSEWQWLWLYPAATLLLAAYSPYIKPRPLWGNLLVALYCAGVPGIVWLGERESLARLGAIAPTTKALIEYTLALFLVFAFIVTLLRELVKDLEDLEGDRAAGRRTLPVVVGLVPARRVALIVGAFLAAVLPLSLSWFSSFPGRLLVLVVAGLWGSLLVLLLRLQRAAARASFGQLSRNLKWYMLGGLLFLLLFRWYG